MKQGIRTPSVASLRKLLPVLAALAAATPAFAGGGEGEERRAPAVAAEQAPYQTVGASHRAQGQVLAVANGSHVLLEAFDLYGVALIVYLDESKPEAAGIRSVLDQIAASELCKGKILVITAPQADEAPGDMDIRVIAGSEGASESPTPRELYSQLGINFEPGEHNDQTKMAGRLVTLEGLIQVMKQRHPAEVARADATPSSAGTEIVIPGRTATGQQGTEILIPPPRTQEAGPHTYVGDANRARGTVLKTENATAVHLEAARSNGLVLVVSVKDPQAAYARNLVTATERVAASATCRGKVLVILGPKPSATDGEMNAEVFRGGNGNSPTSLHSFPDGHLEGESATVDEWVAFLDGTVQYYAAQESPGK